MTKLFITADQVKQTTAISGATDNGLISKSIYLMQTTEILRILGLDLYDKIYNDLYNAVPLTGEYLTIFNRYIIDMHVHWAAYHFTLFNEVKQSNIGNIAPNGSANNTNEIAEKYKGLAVSIEGNLRTYLDKIKLPEWITPDNSDNEITNVTNFY